MKSFITVQDWLMIPVDERQRFRLMFTVNRSTGMQTVDNVVVCDGSTGEDLKAVNIGAMILALWQKDSALMKKVSALLEDCSTLCDNLFKLTIETFIVYDRPTVKDWGTAVGTPIGETISAITGTEEVKPKRRGRPPRKTLDIQESVSGVQG